MGCVGGSDGIYDKDISVVQSGRKVALRVIDNGSTRILDGGIIVPEASEINSRMAQYEVIDHSILANDEYDISKGDIVLADRLSGYYDTKPVQVMDFENIIMKIDTDGNPYPMEGMVFVEPLKPLQKKIGDIILAEVSSSELPLGIITASSTGDFYIGDIVIMTEGADTVTVKGNNFKIYKDHMIIATIELTDDEKIEYNI